MIAGEKGKFSKYRKNTNVLMCKGKYLKKKSRILLIGHIAN